MKVGVVPAHVVRGEHRVEEGHVRGVGGDAAVQERVVRQRAVGADPQTLDGSGRPRPASTAARRCGAGRSGGACANQSLSCSRIGSSRSARVGSSSGIGHVGHRELVDEGALLVGLERAGHVEDRLPVLDRDDPARREGPPVADAVDLVEDRDRRVAGAQEVGVQRVHPPALDGAAGGHERLRGDLAAEDPLAVLVGTEAPERC